MSKCPVIFVVRPTWPRGRVLSAVSRARQHVGVSMNSSSDGPRKGARSPRRLARAAADLVRHCRQPPPSRSAAWCMRATSPALLLFPDQCDAAATSAAAGSDQVRPSLGLDADNAVSDAYLSQARASAAQYISDLIDSACSQIPNDLKEEMHRAAFSLL